jgi:hypothetical protein
MNKIKKCLYTIIFWISRIFSISIFGVCLSVVLNIKYALFEKYFYVLLNNSLFNLIFHKSELILEYLYNIIVYIINIKIIDLNNGGIVLRVFCKNSQNIDLLLIIFVLIIIIGIVIIKKLNKGNKSLLLIVISFVVYTIAYLIFKTPIMIALVIATPITFVLIQMLNKICPIQKVVMLMPIIGEIFCTRNIVKYIYRNSSEKLKDISLLTVVLIISNIICFVIPYKTDKDFENRIMEDWTYSIKSYKDRLIVSGEKELIIIDKEGNDNHIENYEFNIECFVVDEDNKKFYIYDVYGNNLIILDAETFHIVQRISIDNLPVLNPGICCDDNFVKLIFVMENGISGLVDLNMPYNIKYIKGILNSIDSLLYNKYRKSFLISFWEDHSLLLEIDIENRKIRKIKADEYQGYLAISEKNKEIYVAFHQQGRIGVYDAQTMKLKRKIKSNYAVKAIAYDEELNVLIAPSYFTGYVDIFLMDGSDKLLAREFVGYELREGCFDPQKENLYVCSQTGLYRKKIDIKNLINKIKNKH